MKILLFIYAVLFLFILFIETYADGDEEAQDPSVCELPKNVIHEYISSLNIISVLQRKCRIHSVLFKMQT